MNSGSIIGIVKFNDYLKTLNCESSTYVLRLVSIISSLFGDGRGKPIIFLLLRIAHASNLACKMYVKGRIGIFDA